MTIVHCVVCVKNIAYILLNMKTCHFNPTRKIFSTSTRLSKLLTLLLLLSLRTQGRLRTDSCSAFWSESHPLGSRGFWGRPVKNARYELLADFYRDDWLLGLYTCLCIFSSTLNSTNPAPCSMLSIHPPNLSQQTLIDSSVSPWGFSARQLFSKREKIQKNTSLHINTFEKYAWDKLLPYRALLFCQTCGWCDGDGRENEHFSMMF